MLKRLIERYVKVLLSVCFLLLANNSWSQKLYFEVIDETNTNAFGRIESYNRTTGGGTTTENSLSGVFNKSEGWEMVGIDNGLYYYQITDVASNNYGQIDTWDGTNRSNYGNMSSIFTTPSIWTLSGVDDGLLYFQVKDQSNNLFGQIDTWDGNIRTNYGHLLDIVAIPAYWTMTGVDDGIVHIQWIRDDASYGIINSWDGTTRLTKERLSNWYSTPTFWIMTGIDTPDANTTDFISAINDLKAHISGSIPLNATQLGEVQNQIQLQIKALIRDEASIQAAFELVDLYESTEGALFTAGTTSQGGFSRTANGYELENVILLVQQGLVDFSYTEENLLNFPNLFTNVKFETSSFFPGAVTPPANANTSYTVPVNGTHLPVQGSQPNYVTEDARRPTGCYLAPGSIAEVTVPASLVNSGASILVGTHTWDLKNKPTIKRMDRISIKYEITQSTMTIANPLGGGVYINIPYQIELGELDVVIKNVVRSPFYSSTTTKTTSLSEWQNTERSNPAPWTDFETDKFMMQVPTAWVYALNDPETLMNEWDQSLDAVSQLHGRPLMRAKTVLYVQVDVIIRGSANFPGYPQSNHAYNPYSTHTNGNFTGHPLLQGPRYNVNNLNIVFHELGHAEKIPKFSGEIESYVNFLWVAAQNNVFGVDLDVAFQQSFSPQFKMTLNDAAVSWMITESFRNDNAMSDQIGRREGAYQHRGYAKYAEIVKLFGWEALEDFYSSVSDDADNGIIYNTNFDPTDSRILRMSRASGIDLRPLIHFWGVHPLDFNALETSIESEGVRRSSEIYDQLQYYKTIIPMTNQAFRNFGLQHFSQSSITNFSGTNVWSYTEGFYNHWWNDYDAVEANASIAEIDYIIGLYFPDGRPDDPCDMVDIKPFSKINSQGWKSNTVLQVNVGDTINFGPQPFGGTWSWSGPNGFVANTRATQLIATSANQSGAYVVTWVDAVSNCSTSFTYTITVCEPTVLTPYYRINSNNWMSNNTIELQVGDAVRLGPHPVQNTAWTWSGPNGFSAITREVDIINVFANQSGNYVGTYTAPNGCETLLTYSINIEPITTGTNTSSIDNNVSVYPSLVNENVTVVVHDGVMRKISIVNENGITLYKGQANSLLSIPTNEITSGTYFMVIEEGSVRKTVRLIKE